MNKLLFVLIVTVATISCKNQTSTDDKQTVDTKLDTINIVQKAKSDSIMKVQEDSILKVYQDQGTDNRKRRDALKKNFNYEVDEFDNVGSYTHKYQTVDNSWDRKYLYAYVNSNGTIFLCDHYYGDDWIFHTSIQVKIGDEIYKSSVVETYDKMNNTNNSGGSVWEYITYTEEQDKEIIKAIADNSDKEIKVRLNGERYSDFTLSKKDKQAIKDGYELSELIKKVGN